MSGGVTLCHQVQPQQQHHHLKGGQAGGDRDQVGEVPDHQSRARQELLCWDMETGDLVKRMVAHFQRIVEIKSLVVGTDNCVISSSIDRSIKIWDLDHIFEKERHIDKHSLTIDSIR